jgi:hypothetical protein
MKLKLMNRFMYYYGLRKAKEKFIRLVKAFQWSGFGEFASLYGHHLPKNSFTWKEFNLKDK